MGSRRLLASGIEEQGCHFVRKKKPNKLTMFFYTMNFFGFLFSPLASIRLALHTVWQEVFLCSTAKNPTLQKKCKLEKACSTVWDFRPPTTVRNRPDSKARGTHTRLDFVILRISQKKEGVPYCNSGYKHAK